MRERALAYTFLILGCISLVLLAVILIAAWPTVVVASNLFVWALMWLIVALVVGGSLFLLGIGWHKWQMACLARQEKRDALDREWDAHEHRKSLSDKQYDLDASRFALDQHLSLTRLPADGGGNYPIYLPRDQLPYAPMIFAPGNSLHAPRIQRITEEKDEPRQDQLISPQVRQPSPRLLLAQLEPNSLQVSPGVRADTGEPLILSIPDAVHFKLIGSSGFGKSCLAAAMLDQAITLNSPDLLQVALLDLEHKTSKLFEDVPNVATLQVGRRSVPLVATNADEVAMHLGYLKQELDRRSRLSESDLQGEPLLLIYVEEMLSLQYEVDEKLLDQMLKDLSVLAVRARKYNMFLLACAQTDYSTPELKTAQKQFRSRIAFAVDTTAARAAGFMSTELIKYSFTHSQKGDGMFVLETPGVASLMYAPLYDVRTKVLQKERCAQPVREDRTPPPLRVVHTPRTVDAPPVHMPRTEGAQALQAKLEEVRKYRALGWQKIATIEKVWNITRGGNARWKQAEAEYHEMVRRIEQEELEEA